MKRSSILLPVAVAFLIASQVPALAEPPDPNGNSVQINPPVSGPVVTQGVAGYGQTGIEASASSSEKHPGSTYGGYYSGPVYTYEPIPNNQVLVPATIHFNGQGAIIKPYNVNTQAACPPGQTGYYVWGPTGQLVSTICVPDPTASGSLPPGPAGALAQQASSQQPWPDLVVSMNPGTGVTGLPSWFWLGGGSPAIPPATATAGPLSVTVRATLTDIVWDFGDGTQYDSGSSLGRAYPQQSDVLHAYQADTINLAGGYFVTVSIRFAVSYSVNGGPWTPMGMKARLYSQQYQVNQIQPEGVASS